MRGKALLGAALIAVFLPFIAAAADAETAGAETAGAETLSISSVLVTGAFRTGARAARAMLMVSEGDSFHDRAALDRALAASRARMEQTKEYTYIDMFAESAEDGTTEITVSVAESFSSPVGPLILFPNVPVYGMSMGFLVSDTIQAAAFGVLLPFPFDVALAVGNRIMGPTAGIFGRLFAEWTPVPELTIALTQDAGYGFGEGLPYRTNLTTALQATVDLSWLSKIAGFGFSLWGEARKGWYEYDFAGAEATGTILLQPWPVILLKASGNMYESWGDFPPYDDASTRLKSRFEQAPCAFVSGPSEISFRLDLDVGKLFELSFIPLKPGISIFGFAAAGSVLPAIPSFAWESALLAAGGGVEIKLLPPVALAFRAGWSHAIRENAGAFFFAVVM